MARRPTRVVTVEGGIGAGKSSLLAAAEAWFPGLLASGELVVAPEPVALWRAPSGPGGESPLGADASAVGAGAARLRK